MQHLYICQQWVDEVFVNIDESYSYPDELIQELLEMGMVVHVNLAKVKSTSGQKQFVETVGGYTVLTTTMNYATVRQTGICQKSTGYSGRTCRMFLTGIIFIFVALAIYISSPGPIFFHRHELVRMENHLRCINFEACTWMPKNAKQNLWHRIK